MTRLICTAAVLFLSALVPAQLYTYQFTGTITHISANSAGLPVQLDQAFTGWFSFNRVNDQNNNPDVAEYNQNASISLTLPNTALSLTSQWTEIYMFNDLYGHRDDTFGFKAKGSNSGYQFNAFQILLVDTKDTAFSNTDLPPVLSPGNFTQRSLILKGTSVSNPDLTFNVTGELTSVTLVPEPATITILALGALAFRRRVR